METDIEVWDDKIEEVRERMRAWRRSNPSATLTEIEEAVEAELARWQEELVEELAGKAEPGEREEVEHLCPACQTPLQRNGKKKRRLRSKSDQVIELNREQLRCPSCGMTLFPPG